MQVRIARIFNTYGPRMCIDDGRVVSNFVAQVKFCIFFTTVSLIMDPLNGCGVAGFEEGALDRVR